MARKTDIATLLTQRPLFKQVVKEHRKLDLLKDGHYDTEPLGQMVHSHMPDAKWPDKLWTMAVGGEHSEVVFTNKGVMEYGPNGQVILSNKPPKVSDAVRATSAIPGVLASMELTAAGFMTAPWANLANAPAIWLNNTWVCLRTV